MAAVLEQLSGDLAQAPTDPDLIRRFAATCVEEGELSRLRTGLEPALAKVSGPLAVRPVAEALAASLAEQARATSAEAPTRSVELYLRAARILASAANDRVGAARLIAEAWLVLPDERLATFAQTLFIGTQEPPEYTLVALAEVGSNEQRLFALRRLAAMELERRRLDSAETYFKRLEAIAPGDSDVGSGLAVIGEVRKAAQADAEKKSIELGAAPPGRRARLLGEIGDTHRGAGRLVEAEQFYRQAADLGDEEGLKSLERMLRSDGRFEVLAELYRSLLTHASKDRHFGLRRKLFLLLKDDLKRPEEAREVLESSTVGGPSDTTAEAQTRAPLALAMALEERAVLAASTAERLDLLRQGIAAVSADTTNEETSRRVMERLWRKVRALDPRDKDALAFFREHYRQHPDARRAYANLAQLHAMSTDLEERKALAIEMAELSQSSLGDKGGTARSAVERAIEAWRLVETDLLREASGSPEPALVHAWTELRQLYASTGRWHAYVDLLDRWIESETEVATRIELLFDMVGVYQDPSRLPMPSMVLQTYQRIVALAPHETIALDRLAVGLAEREQWTDLLAVLGKKVDLATEPGEPHRALPADSRPLSRPDPLGVTSDYRSRAVARDCAERHRGRFQAA